MKVLTRDVVSALAQTSEHLRGVDVVRVDVRGEQLVVQPPELDRRARVEAPVEVQQRLEDRGEDARAARCACRREEVAVCVLDDRRCGRGEGAFAGLRIVIC